MKDDFGYFGSGLEGYVQYNEAFKRNINSLTNTANTDDSDTSGGVAVDSLSNEDPDSEDQSIMDS